MFSKQFVRRIVQVVSVVALGMWLHTAEVRACFDCPGEHPECGIRVCETCYQFPPPVWSGTCYAGTEGCSVYQCNQDPFDDTCYRAGWEICMNYCYCPPCISG